MQRQFLPFVLLFLKKFVRLAEILVLQSEQINITLPDKPSSLTRDDDEEHREGEAGSADELPERKKITHLAARWRRCRCA